MDAPKSLRPLASEGLLVALATLAGYSIAFSYEAGYAHHFGIPIQFISLELTTILLSVSALLGLGWTVYVVVNPMLGLLRSERLPRPMRERLAYLVLPTVMLVAAISIYGPRVKIIVPFIVVIAFVVFMEVGMPLIKQRKVAGFYNKLAAHHSRENVPNPPSAFDPLFNALGPQRTLLMLVAALAIYAAHQIGMAEAEKREWYYCPAGIDNIVLARSYGVSVIGVQYDPTSRGLTGELVLGTRGQGIWRTLKLEKVGPLIQAEKATTTGTVKRRSPVARPSAQGGGPTR